MKALEVLEQTGYEIRTDGQEIKLYYHGEGEPDPSKVKPLIQDLKEHRDEALVVLRERETSKIFRDALHELSAAWIPGLLEHTKRHHTETWTLIHEAEEALERSWALTLGGKLTLTAFTEAVAAWRDAYRMTIDEHQPRCCDTCDPVQSKACSDFWSQREKGDHEQA